MLSVLATQVEFKSATITIGHDLCLRKTRQANHMIIAKHRVRKAPFSNCFRSTRERKAGILKSVLEKLRFRDGFVWIIRLAVEKKMRFL